MKNTPRISKNCRAIRKCITDLFGILEGEARDKEAEDISNSGQEFPKLMTDAKPQMQKYQRTSSSIHLSIT